MYSAILPWALCCVAQRHLVHGGPVWSAVYHGVKVGFEGFPIRAHTACPCDLLRTRRRMGFSLKSHELLSIFLVNPQDMDPFETLE